MNSCSLFIRLSTLCSLIILAFSVGNVGAQSLPPGLVLHLESDAGLVTSGNTLIRWEDQSGSGNDLLAHGSPVVVFDGLNGLPYISTDGIDDSLKRTGTLNNFPFGASDRSVFFVVSYNSTGSGGIGYGTSAPNSLFGVSVGSSGKLRVNAWGWRSHDFVSNNTGTGIGWLVHSAIVSSNTTFHYLDGALIGSAPRNYQTSGNLLVIGADVDESPFIESSIAAAFVYDRALTGAERVSLEQYIVNKYFQPGGTNDVTPPVIELNGNQVVIQDQFQSYTELGATAFDNIDGDLSANISIDSTDVDVNVPGIYTVSYNVSDSAGNAAIPAIRTVEIRAAADDTAPLITITGDNPVSLQVGDDYIEAGAVALDDRDGDISGSIVSDASSVDTSSAGTYSVTYNVSDAAGNSAIQKVRIVNVEPVPDTTPPVITLLGNDPFSLFQGTEYSEPGATALDDQDGDLSANIVIDGSSVDQNTPGSYLVTYNVSDSAGNAASQVSRVVEVTSVPDTTPPVITITGSNPQTMFQGGLYVELGATAQDDRDGDISASIIVDSSAINPDAIGSYSVTYNVSDATGNAATTQLRTVTVSPAPDTTPPIITLVGEQTIVLELNDSYIELGATALDDQEGDLSAGIVIDSSAVDTSAVGIYAVTYNVSDTAGNAAAERSRAVEVTLAPDVMPPNISLVGDNPQVLLQGEPYVELGATASDDRDGDLTADLVVDSSSVNISVPGTYTVSYNVSDAAGNAANEQLRTVEVAELLTQLSLRGESVLTVLQHASYKEYGASAIDPLDGDVTSSVIIDSATVDTSTVGDYLVGYSVTNSLGNTTQLQRTVQVVAASSETMSFIGPWRLEASMPRPRIEQATVEINGLIYLLGGLDNHFGGPIEVDAYDPVSDTWLPSPTDLPLLRDHFTGVKHDGEIWVVAGKSFDSGQNSLVPQSRVDVLNVSTGVWRQAPSLPVTHWAGPALVINNKLHVISGAGSTNTETVAHHFVLDLANESAGWTSLAPLPLPRVHAAAVALGGKIYVVGGELSHTHTGDTSDVQIYDPQNDSWSVGKRLPEPRSHADVSTFAWNNTIVSVSGIDINENPRAQDTIYQYHPQTDVWVKLDDLPRALASPGSLVYNNRLYTFGGGVNNWFVADPIDGSLMTNVWSRQIDLGPDNDIPVIQLLGADPMQLLLNDTYLESGATATDALYGNLSTEIAIDASDVDTSTVGTYEVRYNVADPAGNQAVQVARTVIVVEPDNTPPVINILGSNPLEIDQGATYSEAGVTAVDDRDGDLSASVSIDASSVDTTVPGIYTVTYNVADAAGNAAVQQTRSVIVLAIPDTTEPLITLLGANPLYLVEGEEYIESGASALDNIDGDISNFVVIDLNGLDTSIAGNFSIHYNVQDSAGNNAPTVSRQVIVSPPVDLEPPEITLNGNLPQIIIVGGNYVEAGAVAVDNVDGDISSLLLIDASAVNVAAAGTYGVGYMATDTSGNVGFSSREVIVLAPDAVPPVIALTGPTVQVILQGSSYSEAGASAIDDLDGDISDSLVIDASSVDTSSPGPYIVSYKSTDSSGNSTIVVRTVYVVQ